VWSVWDESLKECCNCRITGMTVSCVRDCRSSVLDVVVQFTHQSTAERHINCSASTDGDAGQILRHYESQFSRMNVRLHRFTADHLS
jgi:hypothetical protein